MLYGLATLIKFSGGLSAEALEIWLKLGLGGLAAIIASSSVCLEGDSGKPGLANLVALSVGSLAAFLTAYSFWAFPFIAYFSYQMLGAVGQRLHSVEILDIDDLVS